jgi:signal transduction histidine kinase
MSIEWSAAESGYFCVVSDITARKQVERTRQEIIGMLSHDLRAPLMNLQFSLALLAKEKYGTLNERGAEMLAIGERNIERLVRMINELLDLQKLESGSLDIKPTANSVLELCQTAIASLQESANEKQINVVVRVDQGISAHMDRDRIIQAVVNLLANAINYSPKESEVELSASSISENWVEIKVKDRGPGIAEEDRQIIFDRFKRLAGQHTEEARGSGLGLAISKGLVEAHGGTIGVDSALGEGSTFWMRLPASVS